MYLQLRKYSRNDIIEANAGGPYGSKILGGVQSASDKVWDSNLDNSAGVKRQKKNVDHT